MRKIFFTGCLHFGHSKIIGYCNRPFNTLQEMDDELIHNWNITINKNDIIYVLGDFAWKHWDKYANRLKGIKYLIKGNHDKRSNKFYIESCGFNSVSMLLNIRINKQPITLCHYAMRVWDKSHFNAWHLYSHSHGRLRPMGKSYDIGVDNNSFFPISFEKIEEIMNNLPNNPNFIPLNKRKKHG